jgi:parvulin-like peptidyl-prolyl isomerase
MLPPEYKQQVKEKFEVHIRMVEGSRPSDQSNKGFESGTGLDV